MLTRDEQLRVIQWLVELKTTREIAALVGSEFGKKISHNAIWEYKHSKKWGAIIRRLRARFEKNLCKIPIANKADRLRILQKCVNEGLMWSLKTITATGEHIFELKLGEVAQAVKAAREEMEPHKLDVSGVLTVQFTTEERNARIDRLQQMFGRG